MAATSLKGDGPLEGQENGDVLPSPAGLLRAFEETRDRTNNLAAPLGPEDQQVQSMDDTSPTKWHLGHVTWFFETFLLIPFSPGYEPFHPRFGYIFNSYYERVGPRHAGPSAGC